MEITSLNKEETQKKNNNNKTGNQREEEEVGGGGIQHSFLRVGNKQWKDGCRHFMRARKAPKKEHRIEVVNANNKKSFPFLPFFSIFFFSKSCGSHLWWKKVPKLPSASSSWAPTAFWGPKDPARPEANAAAMQSGRNGLELLLIVDVSVFLFQFPFFFSFLITILPPHTFSPASRPPENELWGHLRCGGAAERT